MKTSELTPYAVAVLMEAATRFGIVEKTSEGYTNSKVGYFLLNDRMAQVNLDFVQDICYQGLFNLQESLRKGIPAGLKHLGQWDTIYPGLSVMADPAKKSWFDFDNFYSDQAFKDALEILLRYDPKQICDIGGNSGKFEILCCKSSDSIRITAFDLPPQCRLLEQNVGKVGFSDRVNTVPINILDETPLPEVSADFWWMSQFLDCFSEEQIVSILRKVEKRLRKGDRIAILEPFVGSQPYAVGDQCLSAFSLYFTAIANGTSRFYEKEDFLNFIDQAGLCVESVHDKLGFGHTLIICRKRDDSNQVSH